MGLKLIPPGQGSKLREYYIRFEGSMYGVLHGQNLHSSMNVNQYKKYALLATGVVFTAEADGLTGVSIHWPFLDSPVDSVIDWGDRVYIMTEKGRAVELFFNAEEGGNEDGEDD